MALDIPHEETIDGVKVQYTWDWEFPLMKTLNQGNKTVSAEKYLRGLAPGVAFQAKRKGYKRVQIGSIGEFYTGGVKKGRFARIDSMFVARFLKR